MEIRFGSAEFPCLAGRNWECGVWYQQRLSSAVVLLWVWVRVLFAAAVVVSPGFCPPFIFDVRIDFCSFFFGFLFSFSWLKWMPASLSNLLSAFFPQSTAVGGRRHSSHFSLFVPIVFASLWVMMEEKKGDFCFIKLRLEWLSLCA